MIVLWILPGLLVILLAVGLYLLKFTFGRRPMPDIYDPEAFAKSPWARYTHLPESIKWFKAHPPQHWHVISHDDKVLHGSFFPCENARGTIIQFHGYRSRYEVEFSISAPFYQDLGFNLLLIDQRGNSGSQGRFITFGIKERLDVLSWVTYAAMKLGQDHPIYLSGLSMGATTVCMASDLEFPANVRGILADCGFTSPAAILEHVVRSVYHLPGKPVVAFLNIFTNLFAGFSLYEWSTTEALKNARYPVILFHGLEDDFVPYTMSRESYGACTGESSLHEFPNAGHGLSYLEDMPRYQKLLREFLENHLPEVRP